MPTSIGLVGAGGMGSALGANWIAGGAEVRTCIAGRSERTRSLAAGAGLTLVDSLDDVVSCDVVVSVVPPGAAGDAARRVAAAAADSGAQPAVADLNAIAPDTLASIGDRLGDLPLIDGSISGGPPRPTKPSRVYLAGDHAPRLAEIAAPWLDVVVLDGGLGQASALKMCTASMYKGSTALRAQAMLTAEHFGVLEPFLADVAREWTDVDEWAAGVALAATKSVRFVDEMAEIARTQRAAGASSALFAGVGATYRRIARTPLARQTPESVDAAQSAVAVLGQLRTPPRRPAAVLFDFSSTLFYVESAEAALLAALGPDAVSLADEVRRWGGINGSSTPDEVPPELRQVWADRDLSLADHRAAYSGLSRRAGLTHEQSDALYARGVSAEAWTPFRETLPVLQRLHRDGVPVAMVSNIGWDPRPVLELYGATPYLDTLVLSYEHGVEKPDPAIFQIACRQLGVDASDAVMVGDNAHADGGAVAAGLGFALVPADPHARTGHELADAAGLADAAASG